MRTPHQPDLELQPLDHARHCLTIAIVQHVHNEAAARVVQVQGSNAGGLHHIHRLCSQHAGAAVLSRCSRCQGWPHQRAAWLPQQSCWAECHMLSQRLAYHCSRRCRRRLLGSAHVASRPPAICDGRHGFCWEALMWHRVRQPPATLGMVSMGQHMQSGIAAAGCSRREETGMPCHLRLPVWLSQS